MPKPRPKKETWPIEKLRRNTQQGIFAEPSEAEIRALADDIEVSGLKHPPEILSDGTIITGHKRVAAFEHLKRSEIPVCVRVDLDSDPIATEQLLVKDNLNRRQLTKLAQARCLQRLHELNLQAGIEQDTLRDQLTRQLGCEPRTSNRYLRILSLPREIQNAVENEQLGFREADRFAGLPPADRIRVLQKMEAGESAKSALRTLTAPPTSETPDEPFGELIEKFWAMAKRVAYIPRTFTNDEQMRLSEVLCSLRKRLEQPAGGPSAGTPCPKRLVVSNY